MSHGASNPPAPSTTDEGPFRTIVRFVEPVHVVEMHGGLDLATGALALRACTAVEHVDVVVDLSETMFMDCGGYRALVAARSVLQGRGGSLSLRDPAGEPLRLLRLVAPDECLVAA